MSAEQVVDRLILTPDAAGLRGEWVLDTLGYEWREIVLSGPCTENFVTGGIISVSGTSFGELVGKIKSVAYSLDVEKALATVTLTIGVIET